MTTRPTGNGPAIANAAVWARGSFFREYATRELRPVEVMLLVRYREQISGRVLELGCGAGRLTGYLAEMAREVHGIDLSPVMIEHCRRTIPAATFHEADFSDLSRFDAGSFDAVVAPCNVLDVLSDDERGSVLDGLHRLLSHGGLLVLSSHNRAFVPKLREPTHVRTHDPLRFAADVVRLPRRVRNRRRLRFLQRAEPGYAIINDSAHNYSLLHYYISREAQERQFEQHGFEPVECLDVDGRSLVPGDEAPDYVELHYVARRK